MNSGEIPQYTILKWAVSNTVPDTYGRYSKTAGMFMCLINEFKTGQKEWMPTKHGWAVVK